MKGLTYWVEYRVEHLFRSGHQMETLLHQMGLHAYVQIGYDIGVIDPECRNPVDRLDIHLLRALR